MENTAAKDRFERTRLLFGEEAMDRLKRSRVAVFGIGGVGGYIAEALARSGIGQIDLFDHDKVNRSNLNRQIIATEDTLGKYKVDVMKERILSINPDAEVNANQCFYLPENADGIDLSVYTYIADAVDTVTAKLELITRAKDKKTPVISSMGTGNKRDPLQLEIADIYSTSICPLARVMRRELRKRGIESLKVLYSREEPVKTADPSTVASCAFVPPAAGLIIASEIVKEIAG